MKATRGRDTGLGWLWLPLGLCFAFLYVPIAAVVVMSFNSGRSALNFKGLGPVLVAGCLSEIQDTSRFVTGTKFDRRLKMNRPRTYRDGQAAVAKLAGLWWPRHDSGQVQGLQPFLARERNPYLRYWLVQAAHTLRQYQPDYGRYYWKKYHEAHNHHHKRAIVLTARKAVRLIFALLHKGRLACLEEGLLT